MVAEFNIFKNSNIFESLSLSLSLFLSISLSLYLSFSLSLSFFFSLSLSRSLFTIIVLSSTEPSDGWLACSLSVL